MAMVVINDLKTDRRMEIMYDRDGDFDLVERVWQDEDKLLLDMQEKNHMFFGKTRWCDLTPINYRYMILLTITKLSQLGYEEQNDPNNEVVKSLEFLLGCMIKCLETFCDGLVERIIINYVSERSITFDYNIGANIMLIGQTDDQTKKPNSPFKIVVDNTMD